MLPAPVCRHRAHVSKCASLPSQPPPQTSQQTRQHPQTPSASPGILPGLPRPGRQPASAWSLNSFWSGGRNLISFYPNSGPLIPGWFWIQLPCSPGKEAAMASRFPRVRRKLPQLPASSFRSCPLRVHVSISILSASLSGPCPALSSLALQRVPSSPFLSSCPLSPDSPDPLCPLILLSIQLTVP